MLAEKIGGIAGRPLSGQRQQGWRVKFTEGVAQGVRLSCRGCQEGKPRGFKLGDPESELRAWDSGRDCVTQMREEPHISAGGKVGGAHARVGVLGGAEEHSASQGRRGRPWLLGSSLSWQPVWKAGVSFTLCSSSREAGCQPGGAACCRPRSLPGKCWGFGSASGFSGPGFAREPLSDPGENCSSWGAVCVHSGSNCQK